MKKELNMRIGLLLANLTIAFSFIISGYASLERVGLAVSERFLERLNIIPEPDNKKAEPIAAATLRSWATENAPHAAQYARRVVPLDVLFLLLLGAFLYVASLTFARLIAWPDSLLIVSRLCWMLPAIYIASDLCEDMFIFVLLSFNSTISEKTVMALHLFKTSKMISVSLAMIQVVVLGSLSSLWARAS
jgi:hypothetical protein